MGSEELFQMLGFRMAGHMEYMSPHVGNRRFRAMFGVSPKVCSICWAKLIDSMPQGSKPIYLLWALLFLKKYDTEHGNHVTAGVDEKTFRKWSWEFVFLLADLDVIVWENRSLLANGDEDYLVSLDGTDCEIQEPAPFDRKWFSHKFKSAGLRYEVGVSAIMGHIVWVFGGLPCGQWSDLKLARYAYTQAVNEGEKTLADRGYKDSNFFIQPRNIHDQQVLARHENVNRRIKQFNIVSHTYRHALDRHPRVFHACANLTQLMIDNGDAMFSIE